MELLSAEDGRTEQFPVGMRVLAVDDNPTCLGKLRDLLLLCKYHVTKTTESKKALEMLREKRNMFDLVITDAEMPDTDGFTLLEIGLEMGLPVIMMSAHSDYDSVMKGITHGACDYLIKPVGLKELQNIWQHVVKKNINKYAKSIGPSVSHLPTSISNNQKDKVNDSDREKKDGEGIEHNGQEPFTLKKKKRLRVVWTTGLHQKFVTAVEQLGFEKAVPKKIHELMNVEGLTRVDVTSHLQKYRLCLKHVYEPQQQNMAPDAFGTRDLSYFPKAQLDGELSSTSLLSRSHLTKLPPSACSSINLQGINNSSSVTQQDQNSSNSAYPNGTYHQDTLLPRVENVDRFQPTTTPLEPLLFPKGKSSAYMKSIGEFNSCYQINNQQHETAIKFPNISEKDPSCRFPIMIERFSYGGATRRHRLFFPLMLAAAIALSTFLWFFVSL